MPAAVEVALQHDFRKYRLARVDVKAHAVHDPGYRPEDAPKVGPAPRPAYPGQVLDRALEGAEMDAQAYGLCTAGHHQADAPTQEMAETSGLELASPDDLRLGVHPSPAGPIPVLTPGDRADFVALVRTLAMQNEPAPVPESTGAFMVSGSNNWDRIREYRGRWEAEGGDRSEAAWREEFRRLLPRRALYQDRFLILSAGAYSNVAAGEIGLSDADWLGTSTTIRLEHECTHYFTLRVFGSMRYNLLDEILADYMGITASAGRYRSD